MAFPTSTSPNFLFYFKVKVNKQIIVRSVNVVICSSHFKDKGFKIADSGNMSVHRADSTFGRFRTAAFSFCTVNGSINSASFKPFI